MHYNNNSSYWNYRYKTIFAWMHSTLGGVSGVQATPDPVQPLDYQLLIHPAILTHSYHHTTCILQLSKSSNSLEDHKRIQLPPMCQSCQNHCEPSLVSCPLVRTDTVFSPTLETVVSGHVKPKWIFAHISNHWKRVLVVYLQLSDAQNKWRNLAEQIFWKSWTCSCSSLQRESCPL